MRYALTHCNLIDGTKDCHLQPDMTVIVDGEYITSVAPADQPLANDVSEIDLSGRYLLPGLINLHAHHFGSGKPSKVLSGGAQQEMIIKLAATGIGQKILSSVVEKNVQTALNSGVTTVRGVGDFYYTDVRTRDRINNGEIIGPRFIVSGPAITVTHGHGDGTFAMTADDPWSFRKLVRQNAKMGVDFIKICVTGGVMDSKKRGEAGHLRMTLEETKAVCDEAHLNGYKVASHTESTAGLRVAIDGGVDTIEHGASMDAELVQKFKERKAAIVCTISPALPLAKLPADVTMLSEVAQYNSVVVLDGVIDGAKTALENGIPVGLGTDACCPFVTAYDMWRELVYFQKYVGVSNAFAIYSATLQNAQILEIDNITGSIETGKCADLIVTDQNPLDDLQAIRNVSMVMARGNLIRHPQLKKNPNIEKTLDSIL